MTKKEIRASPISESLVETSDNDVSVGLDR